MKIKEKIMETNHGDQLRYSESSISNSLTLSYSYTPQYIKLKNLVLKHMELKKMVLPSLVKIYSL